MADKKKDPPKRKVKVHRVSESCWFVVNPITNVQFVEYSPQAVARRFKQFKDRI